MAQVIAATRRGKWIFYPLFIFSWCDCMLMFALYYFWHGDTNFDGTIRNGHYFLHEKGHGLIEVSKQIWQLSHYQQLSVVIAYLLTGLVLLLLLKTGDVTHKRNT